MANWSPHPLAFPSFSQFIPQLQAFHLAVDTAFRVSVNLKLTRMQRLPSTDHKAISIHCLFRSIQSQVWSQAIDILYFQNLVPRFVISPNHHPGMDQLWHHRPSRPNLRVLQYTQPVILQASYTSLQSRALWANPIQLVCLKLFQFGQLLRLRQYMLNKKHSSVTRTRFDQVCTLVLKVFNRIIILSIRWDLQLAVWMSLFKWTKTILLVIGYIRLAQKRTNCQFNFPWHTMKFNAFLQMYQLGHSRAFLILLLNRVKVI